MIKNLLNKQSKTITSAAILLGAATLVSKFLGFIRLRLLSGTFGVGSALDAYTVAIKIPDLVFNLLVIGAISSSFIPIFLSFIDKKQEKEGWEFVNGVLNLLLISTAIIATIGIIFAPQIVKTVAPGFKTDPERLKIAIILMRILFANPIIFAISSVMGGVLRSFKRFMLYALAPLLYNIGIIIGIVFFSKYFGIYGVALGNILGALMHFAIQFIGAFAAGFKYKFILPLKHSGIRKLSKLIVPHIMGIATNQVNILIFTFIASRLARGDIFIFNSAEIINSLPIGIFAFSLTIAAFPTLSSLSVEKKWDKFKETISTTFRQILFLIIPSSVIIYSLRAQLVRVVLGAKGVSWQTTTAAVQTLGFLTIGMFAIALLPLLSRAFYALNDTMTPFLSGLASTVVSIVSGFILADKFGVSGLGIAFSAAAVINILILVTLLWIRLKGFYIKKIAIMLTKIIPASFIMIYVMQWTKYSLAPSVDMQTFFGVAFQGFVAVTAGISIYCIVCLALRCEEMILFKDALWRRLRLRRPVQIQEIAEELDE